MLHSKKHPESNMMINIAISEAVGLECTEPDDEKPETTTWGIHNQIRNEAKIMHGDRIKVPNLDARDKTRLLAELHSHYMESDEEYKRLWGLFITSRADALLSPRALQEFRRSRKLKPSELVDIRPSWAAWSPCDEELTERQAGLKWDWDISDLKFLSHVQLNDEITVKPGTWLLTKGGQRDTSAPTKVPECMWFVQVKHIFLHKKNSNHVGKSADLFLSVDWYRTKPRKTFDKELQSPLLEEKKYNGNTHRRPNVLPIEHVHAIAFAVLPHPVKAEHANVALCRCPHALEADLMPCPFPDLYYP